MWFCENCGQKLLYEEFLNISDIVAQMPPVMERFYSDEHKRTCKKMRYNNATTKSQLIKTNFKKTNLLHIYETKKFLQTVVLFISFFLLHNSLRAQVITTVAGNNTTAYSGDLGVAVVNAAIGQPWAVALDNAGNLYIADALNNVVRKVDPAGIITTVAGNGAFGYTGDSGPATSATLSYPQGVAVDVAGNLYIADNGNYVVRKVNTAGTISTFAGNGANGYSGDLGPATSAALLGAIGVAIDKKGNVYISDGNLVVRRKWTPLV